MGGVSEAVCERCGKTYKRRPATLGRFCSRACYRELGRQLGGGGRKPTDPVERFWSKVDKSGDCWVWLGRLDRAGYGQFDRPRGGSVPAHRYAYGLQFGPVPAELDVLHRCDAKYAPGDIRYRACVRPKHLFTGTQADNNADMVAKGRGATPEKISAGKRAGWARKKAAQTQAYQSKKIPV